LRARRKTPRHPVRRRVTREQHPLKENHAGIPDGGCAAELREHLLANHRLHPKQERGTPEQGDGEESGHATNAKRYFYGRSLARTPGVS